MMTTTKINANLCPDMQSSQIQSINLNMLLIFFVMDHHSINFIQTNPSTRIKRLHQGWQHFERTFNDNPYTFGAFIQHKLKSEKLKLKFINHVLFKL